MGLCGDFVQTRAALEQGQISYRHAEKIVQHGLALPPACIADYETRLVPVAERVHVQRLDREARHAVEEAQGATAIQRHIDAVAERRLTIDPAADGMAYLTWYLPAVEAVAIYTRATELARSLKSTGDPRTLTELRVDVLADLTLNGEMSIPGATRGIRPHIRVTVPALTLLHPRSRPHPHVPDRADDPGAANLEGYGPIDRLTALEVTRDAPGFYRVLTDPVTGIALNYGRQRYKPPADLDELIRTVHTECHVSARVHPIFDGRARSYERLRRRPQHRVPQPEPALQQPSQGQTPHRMESRAASRHRAHRGHPGHRRHRHRSRHDHLDIAGRLRIPHQPHTDRETHAELPGLRFCARCRVGWLPRSRSPANSTSAEDTEDTDEAGSNPAPF